MGVSFTMAETLPELASKLPSIPRINIINTEDISAASIQLRSNCWGIIYYRLTHIANDFLQQESKYETKELLILLAS